MEILEKTGLSFDDVLLVPRKSDISSRFSKEIDMSTEFLPGITTKYPIISANMDKVSDGELVAALVSLGGIGIVHRFMGFETHFRELRKVPEGFRIGCIGVGTIGMDRLRFLSEPGLNMRAVLIDIAHGHSVSVLEQIKRIKKEYPKLYIIAGNVATYEGAKALIDAGATSIKAGVGSGSLCSTRIHSGNGVPQITAITECRRAINNYDFCKGWKPTLISDGGIRDGGDFVKALASGADMVMSGSVFAGAAETPGRIIRTEAGLFKSYRGSASREAQEDWKGKATSVEGVSTLAKYKGPVKEVMEDFFAGVKSGFSYQNAHTVKELQDNAVFIRQTTAGYIESTPHGARR